MWSKNEWAIVAADLSGICTASQSLEKLTMKINKYRLLISVLEKKDIKTASWNDLLGICECKSGCLMWTLTSDILYVTLL